MVLSFFLIYFILLEKKKQLLIIGRWTRVTNLKEVAELLLNVEIGVRYGIDYYACNHVF